MVFIPKGFISKGHYSEDFYPEGNYSEDFYPEGLLLWRYLSRRVIIRKGRYSEFRNNDPSG